MVEDTDGSVGAVLDVLRDRLVVELADEVRTPVLTDPGGVQAVEGGVPRGQRHLGDAVEIGSSARIGASAWSPMAGGPA